MTSTANDECDPSSGLFLCVCFYWNAALTGALTLPQSFLPTTSAGEQKLETRHSDHFLQKEVWCLTHSRQILKTAALFCWWNWRKFSQEVLICTGIYCICFFSCCHPAPTPMHTRWTGLLCQELFVTAYVTSANESPLQNGGYNHLWSD